MALLATNSALPSNAARAERTAGCPLVNAPPLTQLHLPGPLPPWPQVSLPERVDVLVSEPMGTLLVNERMLETYIYARNHFLKPGGKMFPQVRRSAGGGKR